MYGDIAQIEALQEAQLQIYTPNTKFWWRLAELVYAHVMSSVVSMMLQFTRSVLLVHST